MGRFAHEAMLFLVEIRESPRFMRLTATVSLYSRIVLTASRSQSGVTSM